MKKFLIQPCCCKRHLLEMRNAIGSDGTADFEGYGDLSLTELLPAIMTRYSETDVMIVAPSVPDQAAEIIAYWMRKKNAMRTGPGSVDVIRHLTIVADLSKEKSPAASGWTVSNPFNDRLEVHDVKQGDTAILLPDFVITGPVNMRYGHHFTATATTDGRKVDELWRKCRELIPQTATDEGRTKKRKKSKRTAKENGDDAR